ncbi:GNAT family N-acetyltransferase [Flagellimonas algicola]|uniref:GNAT family N-acetyltransferase n=1 Tax=Flagellimonas algicola TaxID=2583815 RepID=A0ABY2WQD1_9FLAO|nr:GNAT family protein [Allomuricauda algicola]TMU57128.1 GNAT family N-acetyltransferase [Allomuricauda algicola]
MKVKLETERLLISPISLADLGKIHELHSLAETDKFNTLGIPENIEGTEQIVKDWIAKNNIAESKHFTLKIESVANREFIGLIAINLGPPKFRIAEVWYKLHSDFWKQGYATESLHRLLEFGFNELQLHRIEAGCAVENLGSIRVLEKVGMTREGRKRQVLPLKQGWSDNFHFAILATDFKTKH